MKREILLKGNRLCYDLQRKQVKNINLRVREGKISVSAPAQVPFSEIERFMTEKADAILRTIAKAQIAQPPRAFVTGETFLLFGNPYRLTVYQGSANTVRLLDGEIALTVKHPENAALRERTLTAFLKQRCEETVAVLCHRVHPFFAKRGIPFPTIRFRSMKSRWGSCHTGKHVLTFNYSLTETPLAFAEYVVVHEFCHLIHADHSAAFYGEVERLLPDWKARKALVK